jgi:hypothetical protein
MSEVETKAGAESEHSRLCPQCQCITKVQAIKQFFNSDGYPTVENKEMLSLAKTDKDTFTEIAILCARELGVQLKATS